MPGRIFGGNDLSSVKKGDALPLRSWVAIVILLSVMFAFLPLCPSSFAGEVLDDVRTRKIVRCGVNEELAGFALRDRTGRWQGGEPDFCRAVAAAVLGDAGRVEFLPLKTASRFPILLSGRIDLLVHSVTMTFGREAGIGVRFPGIYFFDGQAFMHGGRADRPFVRRHGCGGDAWPNRALRLYRNQVSDGYGGQWQTVPAGSCIAHCPALRRAAERNHRDTARPHHH
jgi:hypothetical protein